MYLTLKQRKILKLLSINCRFTNKDIAKVVGVSQDTVAYQVKKLIDEQKIGFFNVQFVHSNLGYKSHHHWIKFETKRSAIDIEKIPHVNSINSSFGKFDYQILSYTRTKKELEETKKAIKKLNPLNYAYAEQVEQYKRYTNIIPPLDIPVKTPKNSKKFEYAFSKESYELPLKNQVTSLDSVDKKIIRQLIKNPRCTFQEINEATGINHETIRYRIKKYVNERLINNFGIVHNHQSYGLFPSYFLIKADKINEEKFIKYLKGQKHIFYCPKLKGDYQAVIYIVSSNPSQIGQIYNELFEVLGNCVRDLDLLFFNKIHKYVQFPEKILEGY